MKPLILLLFSTLPPFFATAQRVVTLDPEKEPIARRTADGAIQLVVSPRLLMLAIQEAIPQMTDIQTPGIEKIGRSNYLVARGKDRDKPEVVTSVAILLAETGPGEFQTDNLVISCSSSGDCRECSLPPNCTCSKGTGSCGQGTAMMTALKKVSITLFD